MILILIKFALDMDQVIHGVNNYRKIALYNLPLSIQILAINLFITCIGFIILILFNFFLINNDDTIQIKKINANEDLKKGNLELDDLKQLCHWKNEIVELTVAEFNLIKSLAKYPGVVKDRNQLMDTMYGDSIYVDDRTIDSHIKRLRKKFKSYDPEFDQIRTRYGSGYSWRE